MRSREILNADTIVGRFDFNQNLTSNCAGITSGCTHPVEQRASTSPASCSATPATPAGRCSTRAPTRKRGPSIALYFQDDIRVTNRLTVNAGLRWDVYVPWVEVDNKQSNFDVVDRPVRGRVRRRDDQRRRRSGAICRPIRKTRLRSAPRLRLRSRRRRPHDRPRRLRHVLELHAGRHLVVEGAEPAVPAGDRRSRRAWAPTSSCQNGLDRAAGRAIPNVPPAGTTRSAFLTDFRDAHAHNFNVNVQRQLGIELHGGSGVLGIAHEGRRAEGRSQPGAVPTVGVTDQNVNRPFAKVSPALRTVGALSSTGYRRVQRPAAQVPAPFREPYLVHEFVHVRPRHRPELGQRRHGHADRHLPSRVQPRTGGLRRDAHVQLELDLRAAVGGAARVGRLAAERHPVSALGPADHHHAVAEHAVDRPHEQPAEHDLRSGLEQSDDRPVVQHERASSRWPTPPARSATRAATRFADRGSSTSTRRSSRTRRSGRWPPSSGSKCSTC